MNETERYLFDVQGFIVVENALPPAKLKALNQALDRLDPWAPDTWKPEDLLVDTIVSPTKLHVGPLIHRDPAFLDLIDNPVVIPYLVELIGEKFRLDHEYAILMKESADQLRLHGGGEPYSPIMYYVYKNGRMFNGLVAISYALTDVGPGDGGFCCIPGSHKSNVILPDEFKPIEGGASPVIHVPQQAGSAIIFTEALTHGTMPWKRRSERRSLLYKYFPGHQSWMEDYRTDMPKASLTERQQRIMEPPYVEARSSVQDGVAAEYIKADGSELKRREPGAKSPY